MKTVYVNEGPSSQKKYLFAKNVDWFFRYGVENICKLMNLANERNKKLNVFSDPILIKLECNQKLSQNKMTYFDDLVIHFGKVFDIDYRGKIRFDVDTYVCRSKIMLPA